MKTAEEILTDELSEGHVYILNTTPKLKDWIIDAMKIYANQKLDQAAAEATASIGYGILGTKMPEYHPVVNKKSILRLKDNI